MGSEIVYCGTCQKRIIQDDFQKRQAFVIGVQTYCLDCVKPILLSLTPEQRQIVLSRQASLTTELKRTDPEPPPAPAPIQTRTIPAPRRTTQHLPVRKPKSSQLVLVVGGVAAFLVLIAVIMMLSSGNGNGPTTQEPDEMKEAGQKTRTQVEVPGRPVHEEKKTEQPPTTPPPPEPVGNDAQEALARVSVVKARSHAESNPEDLDGYIKLCQAAVWEAEGTSVQAEAQKLLEEAVEKQKAALAPEIKVLEESIQASVKKKDYATATDLMDTVEKRHQSPIWTAAIGRLRDLVRKEAASAMEVAKAGQDVLPIVREAPVDPPVERKHPERRQEVIDDGPAEFKLVCYLDCGPDRIDGVKGGPILRLRNGTAYEWPKQDGDKPGRESTVAFGDKEVVFEAYGLDPEKAYLVGFAWWDGDSQRRAQSVWAMKTDGRNRVRLLDTSRMPGHKARPAERVLAVPRALYADGRFNVAFRSDAGSNAVVGELWLWESGTPGVDPKAVARAHNAVRMPSSVVIPGGPPSLKSALSLDPKRVDLLFNKPVNAEVAAKADCYAIAPGITVESVTVVPGRRRVSLATSPLEPGTLYTVTVQGVTDDSGSAIAEGASRPFTPLRIPREGLALWIRPEAKHDLDGDGYVRRASDDSGRGHHAVQPGVFKRPLRVDGALNGWPILRYDGKDDALDAKGPRGQMKSFSFFVLLKPASCTDYRQTICATGHWGQFVFHSDKTGGVYVGSHVKSRISPDKGPKSGTMEIGRWQLYTYIYLDGTGTLYRNGRRLASRAIQGPSPWGGFRIGSGDANTIHGDLAELMIYTTGLDAKARRAVERYLHEKYYDPEEGVPPLARLTVAEMETSPLLKQKHESEVERVLDAFKQEIAKARSDNEKATAIWTLGNEGVRDPRIAARISPYLTMGNDMVRGEAIAALSVYRGNEKAVKSLNTAVGANASKPRVLEKLIDALGRVRHPSSVRALRGLLGSVRPNIAPKAARALGNIRTPDSVDALLSIYERLHAQRAAVQRLGSDARKAAEARIKQLEPAIKSSLEKLTGQKLAGCAEYKSWWRENRKTYQ
jgi:hypothetical protein